MELVIIFATGWILGRVLTEQKWNRRQQDCTIRLRAIRCRLEAIKRNPELYSWPVPPEPIHEQRGASIPPAR